ncbi:energy-coupling factor ABC transporter ATP-binding protein [Gracilibacillus caseinilyticus]|uniref:Energy-coupling factor transporter ATP-binding protein EcfA2 n=1 Tax=Gracilibacillus caseinilyticus TaxID=2932256 RepID=A0ABY4EZI6_9BACI|nr:energy-coupling factor ABC transporter ATP-binding protein [Gracilibacillus caseinilyticus]UOQ49426.1 energy-coupling factor ABC transporter ATP-binding protein [Gracilibacillus caseinilyticus]
MDIRFEQVNYTYQQNTPFSYQALADINLSIQSGEYIAIVGHTGSGKSTLLQHINGLLLPSEGKVVVGDFVLSKENKRQNLKKLREKVGVVFQYPEHQLFEETVDRDIQFALKNFHVPESEREVRVLDAIEKVGLSEDILEKSPFEISGGQMRRVAIAGVLAMNPDVLILDEPTAGLDPKGQRDMMDMFAQLHDAKNMTTILVTHQMQHALQYADRIYVLAKGSMLMEGSPEEIFSNANLLEEANLDVPDILDLMGKLKDRLQIDLQYNRQSISQLATEIAARLRETKQ